jgi:hypothetical protein
LTAHRGELLVSGNYLTVLAQRVIKEEKGRKYMKRELGERFKLFLERGTLCVVVRKRRRRRWWFIHKIEEELLKIWVSAIGEVYCEGVRKTEK